jgi:hypothetical protein
MGLLKNTHFKNRRVPAGNDAVLAWLITSELIKPSFAISANMRSDFFNRPKSFLHGAQYKLQ